MRRALDIAKARLDQLAERDAILEAFFSHAASLFGFAALFVVRGGVAHGRFARGVGAPSELVARIVEPVTSPGILAQACELRKPMRAPARPSEADERLYGLLGRAMPHGLAVPVVVRDRVVAVFLGDQPTDGILARAKEAGRSGVELTREEMVTWSGWVGEALERVIVRKKSAGSVPPPAFSSSSSSGLPSFPTSPPVPSIMVPTASEPASADPTSPRALEPLQPLEEPSRASFPAGSVLLLALVVLAIAGGALWVLRRDSDAERILVPARSLTGYPASVDPATLVTAAEPLVDRGAELASLRIELDPRAGFDLGGGHARAFATLVFVLQDRETSLRVDNLGLHTARRTPRTMCGPSACLLPVMRPTCSLSQIRGAAIKAGLREDERASLLYADGRSASGSGRAGPEWLLAVEGRGQARIDAATCALAANEGLMPAAVPLAALGGGAELDAFELLPKAREHSGLGEGAELLEIVIRGVRPSGRVGLSSGEGQAVYVFSDPLTVPAGERRWREVRLTRDGFPVVNPDGDRRPLPPRLTGPVQAPACRPDAVYRTVASETDGMPVTVTYAAESPGRRAGAYKIETPTAGVLRRISDLGCAALDAPREVRPARPRR